MNNIKGYISSCGLTMIVLVLTILFLFLMIIASSIRPAGHVLRPRCVKRSFDDSSDVGLYLVHNDDNWQQRQLVILEEILNKYNQCDIELLLLRNDNTTVVHDFKLEKGHRIIRGRHKRHVRETTFRAKLDGRSINIGPKTLVQFLEMHRKINSTSTTIPPTTIPVFSSTLPPPSNTLEGILKKFPRLTITNTTKKEFFENTPLFNSWRNFNNLTLNFAARVLKLWEYGGISFQLPHTTRVNTSSDFFKYHISQNTTSSSTASSSVTLRMITPDDQMKIVESMIDVGYASFKTLPDGLVTVDEEGVHMETKTTCHAFFGEALSQLRRANYDTTVQNVIKDTLKTFCVKGAVDSEYCNNVKSKNK